MSKMLISGWLRRKTFVEPWLKNYENTLNKNHISQMNTIFWCYFEYSMFFFQRMTYFTICAASDAKNIVIKFESKIHT